MAASKQIDCERNVSLRGKTMCNIFHVLIEAKYLVDKDNAGKGPISLWTCYVSLELATTGLKRSHVRCLCHNYLSPPLLARAARLAGELYTPRSSRKARTTQSQPQPVTPLPERE